MNQRFLDFGKDFFPLFLNILTILTSETLGKVPELLASLQLADRSLKQLPNLTDDRGASPLDSRLLDYPSNSFFAFRSSVK